MNIRRAAARASIAALLPFAERAGADGAGGAAPTAICGARSKNRNSDSPSSNASSRSTRKPPRPRPASAPKITASASRVQVGSADDANFVRLRGTLARRRAHLRRRLGCGNGGYLPPAPRPSDVRRHLRQHLRLQVHAGLRQRPRGHRRCVHRRALQSGRGRHVRQVQATGRTRASAELRRTSASSSADCRPTSCRTAISVCNSRVSSRAAWSATRWATSTASPTARAATT